MQLESDTMTATERVLACINHEEPDRLPIFLMGMPDYSQTMLEFREREDELFDEWTEDDANILFTPLGDYTLRYFFGSEFETFGIGCSHPGEFHDLYLDAEGKVATDPAEIERLSKAPEGRAVNSMGTIRGWQILESGHRYTWYVDGYLKTKETVLEWYDRYGWPQEGKVRPVDVNTYKDCQAQFGDRIFVCPQIGGMQLYEGTWPIMGQERWAYYSRKDPDFIHQLIDSRKQVQLRILDEIARLKPPVVFGGDDMGQKARSMFSPRWFDTFLRGPYTEIFTKIHEEIGAKVFIHSCGNIVDHLPNLVECGLDGWQSLEVPSEIDYAALKRKFGDRMFFVGALDSSREMCFGTPASIEAHVRLQIRLLGSGGGYIPGPAHDYLNVPLDNALAMRDAVHKWGRYPLGDE